MKVFALFFLCYVCLSQSKVVFVVEMCRHGSRAPTKFYSWDYDGRWANGPGELTPMGMRQHFLLGSEFRYRYIGQEQVLDDTYLATDVYFRATDYNRTIMSGQSQIMGLYPAPTGPSVPYSMAMNATPPITVENLYNLLFQLNGKALPNQFQVFPVHVFPTLDDFELQANAACAQLSQNINLVVKSEAYRQVVNSNPEVLSILGEALPDVNVTKSLSNIIDDIICNLFVGNQVSPLFTPTFVSNATEVFNQLFALPYQSDVNARLFSSWFFLDLLQHLEAVLEGTEPTRFRLYSAHDTTIAGILAGMQVYDNLQPPFASSLIYEVSEEDTDFFIRVLYNDEVLIVPTCSNEYCALSVFMTYLRLRAYPNQTEACSLPSSIQWEETSDGQEASEETIPSRGSGNLSWVGWLAIGLVAVVLPAFLLGCFFCRKTELKPAPLLDSSDFNSSGSSKSSNTRKVINLEKEL